jgi:hypothetical protein
MELVPALWNNKNEEAHPFSKLLDLTSNHAPFTKDLPATQERYKTKKEVAVIAVLTGGVMRSYAT